MTIEPISKLFVCSEAWTASFNHKLLGGSSDSCLLSFGGAPDERMGRMATTSTNLEFSQVPDRNLILCEELEVEPDRIALFLPSGFTNNSTQTKSKDENNNINSLKQGGGAGSRQKKEENSLGSNPGAIFREEHPWKDHSLGKTPRHQREGGIFMHNEE